MSGAVVEGRARRFERRLKLTALVKEYPKVLLVGVQNVRSSQLQQIRIALRGKAEVRCF